MRAKQEGLNAMHVKVEKFPRQQIRTAQRIITLKEKMTCQKTQSEASQAPRGRTMEPLPKAQERKAKLRRHPISPGVKKSAQSAISVSVPLGVVRR